MKMIFALLLFFTLSLNAPAKAASPVIADGDVVVTIAPLYGLVSAIMDGLGRPELLLQGGASPHDSNLRPSLLRKLYQADMVFLIDRHFEAPLAKAINSASAVKYELALAKGVKLLPARQLADFSPQDRGKTPSGDHDGHDDHDDHDEQDGHGHSHSHSHDHDEATDFHIWLDPENAIAMADQIAAALAKAYPDHQALFMTNKQRLQGDIRATSRAIHDRLTGFGGARFIVLHDAYHYFENAFGLQAAAVIHLQPDQQPSPAHLSALKTNIRQGQISCVFREPQFSPKLAEMLVDGTTARLGVIDPLTGAQKLDEVPAMPSYINLLEGVASGFIDCLS